MGAGDKSPTNKLYKTSAYYLTTYSTIHIALEMGSMAAYSSTTNALVGESTYGGLVRAAATLSQIETATTDDTCRATKTFTCSATSATIIGHVCTSTASTVTYDMLSWYYYAAAVPLTTGDTLTCTNDHQYEIGV
jgi:hypothetical protein